MSTKVDPSKKQFPKIQLFWNFVYIALQTVASLQNLVKKHTLEVPPVFNGLNELTIQFIILNR